MYGSIHILREREGKTQRERERERNSECTKPQIVGFPATKDSNKAPLTSDTPIWVVVKIVVPFWIPILIRHLIIWGTPKGINPKP